MRRSVYFTGVAALVAGLLLHGTAAAAVNVPDKNLEAALRATLQDAKGELTEQLLANVFVLDAAKKGIKDLTGLEKCKNLAQLNLAKNEVADLAPLKELTNLQWLDLSNNQVADLAPLAGLVKLQYLEL